MDLSVFLCRFRRFVDLSFLGCPANGGLAVARVHLFGAITQLSARRLNRRSVRRVDVVFNLVDVFAQRRSRLRRFKVDCVVGARRVNAYLFCYETVNFRYVQVSSQGRLSKAISRTFIRINVRFAHRVNVFVGRLLFYIAMRGLLIRPISINHLVVDVNGVPSDRQLKAIVATGPIEVKRISTGNDQKVWVSSRSDNDSCFNDCSFRLFLFGLFIRE